MRTLFQALAGLVRASLLSRRHLMLENLSLRQQVAVLKAKNARPRMRAGDRLFWVLLRGLWSRWQDALIVVKPETVIRWHRQGFRSYWRRKSARGPGRPKIDPEIRSLVRRLASENPTWGAPRIHGELQMLGFNVGERTVSRYLRRRPPDPERRQSWSTFLRNHREVLAAMDFFTVPTASFRILYVLFVIHHSRRTILHVGVTPFPTAIWIAQQLREAFPYDEIPKYLIHDRDSKFGREVVRTIRGMDVRPVRIAFRSPWQNGVAERWIQSARRDLLDRVIVLGERHLHRLLKDYVRYYHEDRCHLGLAKDCPVKREPTARTKTSSRIVGLPRVGGMHHRYEWREAA